MPVRLPEPVTSVCRTHKPPPPLRIRCVTETACRLSCGRGVRFKGLLRRAESGVESERDCVASEVCCILLVPSLMREITVGASIRFALSGDRKRVLGPYGMGPRVG